jgi:hypothetical protein
MGAHTTGSDTSFLLDKVLFENKTGPRDGVTNALAFAITLDNTRRDIGNKCPVNVHINLAHGASCGSFSVLLLLPHSHEPLYLRLQFLGRHRHRHAIGTLTLTEGSTFDSHSDVSLVQWEMNQS